MQDRSKRGLSLKQAVYDGENLSGWEAVDYKVIVKKDAVQDTTVGGIAIPEEAQSKERWEVQTGVIVSFGSLAFTQGRQANGEFYHWNPIPAPGNRVLMSEYAGTEFEGADGEKYILVKDKDIGAIQ